MHGQDGGSGGGGSGGGGGLVQEIQVILEVLKPRIKDAGWIRYHGAPTQGGGWRRWCKLGGPQP